MLRKYGAWLRLGLGLGCFVMAALSFMGVGTMDEPNGRVIFGLLWACVGVLWMIRYVMAKNRDVDSND